MPKPKINGWKAAPLFFLLFIFFMALSAVADNVTPITMASPPGGGSPAAQGGTLTANEPVTIYYTTNGSDTTAPVTAAAPTGGTYSSAQSVTLTANEPATIYYTTNGSAPTTSSVVYSGQIPVPVDTILKFFAQDMAGNSETVKTETYTINLDSTPLTGSIAINGGATYTNSTSVTLDLTCTDAGNDCTEMQLSNDNSSWSNAETFATSKAWTLADGEGAKTVYVKFKDGAGNWSNAVSAAITLDTVAPSVSNGAPSLDSWNWRNPLPTGNTINGVTYGNATYVAVGDFGTILTSPDGTAWTQRASGTSSKLTGVSYGNSIFVAVGYDNDTGAGTILTSTDGATWTARSSADYLYGVTYGNSTFVVVGDAIILTSSNGSTWDTIETVSQYSLSGVTYGNSTFVATEYFGRVLTSTDGYTWTEQASETTQSLYGVTYGNSTFVAAGSMGTLLTSTDGVTWTTRTSGTTAYLNGVTYGNATFVAVGNSGTILTSANGVTWTIRTSGTTASLTGVTYGNSGFVAIGTSGTILASPDGTTWVSKTVGTRNIIRGVFFGNSTYVAVGASGTLLISADGVTWSGQVSGATSTLIGGTYGNSTFVVVGGSGTILTSTDGKTWTTRTSGVTQALYSITYANSIFVTVGASGKVLTSPDGVTWTPRTSGTTATLYGVTYANATFVAVGPTGTILTSPDGINWTSRTSGTTATLYGVTYANSTFVVVASTGTILTSPDGVTWTSRISGITDTIFAVTYGNSTFVAVRLNGLLLASSDGTTWTSKTLTTNPIYGVAYGYGNSTFVAVGGGGTILQSGFGPGIEVTINSRASSTNSTEVTLALTCVDSGSDCVQMQVSNDNFATYTTLPYTASQSWTLSAGDGTKAVSVKFQDGAGNWSEASSATITLDATSPTVSASTPTSSATGVAINAVITATFSEAMDMTTIGDGTFTLDTGVDGSVTYKNSTKTATFTPYVPLAHNTTYTATISNEVKDLNGNAVAGDYSWSFTTTSDALPPDGTITINSGAAFTNSTAVSLSLACTDDNGCSRMQFSNDNSTWSTPVTYGSTAAWSMPSGDGPKTVYARFQDGMGNWSGAVSAAITLDTIAPAAPGSIDDWLKRNPLIGETVGLNGVTYGNSTFVAVGNSGTILTSPNGASWTVRTSGTTSYLYGVAYGNSIFVGVGASGTILTSPDGVIWTPRTSGTTNQLNGVAYINSSFVAVGASGTILTSSDGTTWTSRASGTSCLLKGVSYGNSTIVVVGYSGIILTSIDGVTWTTRSSGTTSYLTGVTYANSTFVAVGYISGSYASTILTSPDGIVWTSRISGTISALYGVTYANSTFVAAGGNIFTSPDGVTWTTLPKPKNANFAYGVAIGNSTFVAVGPMATIMTSRDYVAWNVYVLGEWRFDLNGVASGNSVFVAVGNESSKGKILVSPDGSGWNLNTLGIPATTGPLTGVTYGNSTFVAVGSDSVTYADMILTSPDGVTWTSSTLGTSSSLKGVTYGNSTFVSVGMSGTILTSLDGINWTTSNSGTTTDLYRITYVKDMFVAFGEGNIFTSLDGATWTDRPSAWPVISDITYGNSTFVSVAGNSVYSSPDGETWTTTTLEPENSLYRVSYAYSTFVAVGESTSGPIIMTSPDGVVWSTTNRSWGLFTDVTSGNYSFVVVGLYGEMWQTGPGSGIAINSGAASTNSTAVTLALSCVDDGSGCATMQLSNDNFATSTTLSYTATQAWTLISGDGAKTVSVKFQDGAGNWSGAYNSTITLDTRLTITPSAGLHGSISPNTPQLVTNGSTTQFTVTPDAGYTASVGGTCGGTLVGTTYITNTITSDCTVEATFTLNSYTVTASSTPGGSITPSGEVTVIHGDSKTFTLTADPGYTFQNITGTCPAGSGDATSYTTGAVTADCTVTASFADGTPPVISNSSPANGSFINTGRVGYTLSEAVASGSIVFTASGGAEDTSSPRTYTLTAPDMTAGSHTISSIPLQNGTVYTITFNAVDAANNAATPVTITDVTYDTSSAVVTLDSPAPGSRTNSVSVSYSASERLGSATITATRTSGSEDTNVHSYILLGDELAAGSHSVNTGFILVNGAVYTFAITTISDRAANPGSDVSISGITFDSTALPVALTLPTSGSAIIAAQTGFTLGEDATAATITFTRTGGTEDPGSPHSYTLTGSDLLAGSRTIATNLPLVEGTVYSISLAATDLAGNPATTVTVTGVAFAVLHPLVLTGLPAGASYGQAGIIATVTGGNGSGAVSYSHGSSSACTVDPASGAVTITSGNGSCTITATKAADANFTETGSEPVTILISRAGATITLDSTTLSQDYTGTARTVTATTSPAGLGYSITYSGSTTPPTAIGSYAINATISDANYQGGSSGTLVVSDLSAPAITSFTALPRANTLIADTSIVAEDNVLVTGYCLAEGVDSSGCSWSTTAPSSYTFATPGAKTLFAYVRDAAGNIGGPHGSTLTVTIPTLSVTVNGTGSGTVTSAPSGIACTVGNCTGTFSGTVTLHATPSVLSLFGGWSGGVCSGTSTECSVAMSGNKSVMATFTLAPLRNMDGTPYASLQAAYDAAVGGAIIQLLESTVTGTLTANRAVSVKLKGGYNATYSATPGETAITAPLRIRQGRVVADKVNVR